LSPFFLPLGTLRTMRLHHSAERGFINSRNKMAQAERR
jgi:hypothetical protein